MGSLQAPFADKRLLLTGLFGFMLLDQASKWLVQTLLPASGSWPIIPGLFQLTLAYNTGAAFSLLRQQPVLLLGLTSLIFLSLLAYAFKRPCFLPGERWALAMILGGALGNLIDRFRLGRVTDFLDVIAIHYPVFNLADSFIFCGVLLLLWAHLVPDRKARNIDTPMPETQGPAPETHARS